MSLVVRCHRCEKDHEIPEKNAERNFFECPHCNNASNSENFSAVMFCPHCYAELLVPFDVLKRELQCPYCDKVFRANLTFSLSESDEDENFREIEKNSRDSMFEEGDIFDKYKIIRLLGKGGMGEVYLARHMLLQRDIALKIMNNDAMVNNPVYAKRFIREAKLANRIDSENFIAVYDAGKESRTGSLFIAMEYVDGQNVSEIMKDKGVFAEKDILNIALKITEVLIILEREKIVHRDIKPSNIMVSCDGTVKLADFGIAKSENSNENELTLTQGNLVFGTPNYASPEQCRSSHNVDFRSDIYSLGATMFHMAAGQPPYDGTTAMETVIKVLNEEHQDLSKLTEGYSSGFILLVNDMIERDPEKRPPNAEALKMRIEHLLSGRMKFADCMRITAKIAITQLRYIFSKIWEITCKIFTAIPVHAIKRIIKTVILLLFICCGIFFCLKYRHKFIVGFNFIKSEIALNIPSAPEQSEDEAEEEDEKTEETINSKDKETVKEKANNNTEPEKEIPQSDAIPTPENKEKVSSPTEITRDNFEISGEIEKKSEIRQTKEKNNHLSSTLNNDTLYVTIKERLKLCNQNLNALLKSEDGNADTTWTNERIKFYNTLQKNLQQQLKWRSEAYALLKHNDFDENCSLEIQKMIKNYSRLNKNTSFINNDKIFAQQLMYYLKDSHSNPNVIITDVSHPDFSGPLLRWLEHADIPLKKDIEKILFEHHVSSDCISGDCSIEVCQYGVTDLSGILRRKIIDKKYSDAIALVYCGADVNEVGNDSLTPLHLAALYNNKPLARTLLLAGGNTEAKDQNGQTPLFYAVKYSDNNMYNMLMLAGADSSVTDNNGKKAIHYNYVRKFYNALQKQDGSTAENLLKKYPELVNMPMKLNMTPLQSVCGRSAEMVDLLLKYGADVNKTTESMPYTPLQKVCNLSEQQKISENRQKILLSIFKKLLNANAETNLPPIDSSYATILQSICCNHDKLNNIRIEFIKELLPKSNIEKELIPVFEKLYEYNNFTYSTVQNNGNTGKILTILLNSSTLSNNNILSAIIPIAAWSPKCTVADIDMMLEKGADINGKDSSGRTALYKLCEYAAKRRMYLEDEAISKICTRAQYLLNKGADKNITVNGKNISDLKLPERLKLTLSNNISIN